MVGKGLGRGCCLIKGFQPSAEVCPHAGAVQGPVPKDKQKKKKKETPRELHSDPPIRRTLGTRKVTLEALLATKDLVATVCDFGILITKQPLQPPNPEEKVRSESRGRGLTRPVPQLAQASLLSLSSPLHKMGLK